MALTWYYDADWDGNGAFEANEADHLQELEIKRGRDYFVKPSGDGFERQGVGTASAIVRNNDRKYDPYNTGSSIYPNVKPGIETRIRVNDGVTTYTLFRGKLENPIPVGAKPNLQTRFPLVDGWRWLLDRRVRKSLQTSRRTDQCISDVLTAADWPSAWGSSLGAGSDTLDYWWVEGSSAADAINDLVESEMAQFYISTSGVATFGGRQSLYNGSSSFTLIDSTTGLLDEIATPQPWEIVRNIIRIKCHPRITVAATELWRMQDIPYIGAGESLTVWGEFTYSNRRVPANNVVSPVATTDYTMNTASDGSGTNLTANFTVTPTVFGETIKNVIANTGAVGGYVTLLKVRGDAIDSPNTSLIEVDNSSGSAYGPRSLTLDLPWQQNVATATDMANWLKSWMGAPLLYPVIRIRNNPALQFGYDLFTRLTFTSSTLGINTDFRIAKIEHRAILSGADVTTTWKLEPVDVARYWKFTTQIGVTSRFAY